MNTAKIVIVYHSGYGHTARQAKAVLAGAKSVAGTSAHLIEAKAHDFPWAELEDADAIIFGCPTYMGGPSAVFKAFQEATSQPVFAAGFKWKNKFAAGFTNSAARSGDKLATLQQMAVFAAQHGMHWINLGLPPGNNSSSGSENDLNRLGIFMGAAAQSNADQSADVVPPESDLRTAEHLGQRVATVALQYARGRQ